MRALLKVGFSLLLLAFLLIGVSYSMLRAQVASGAATTVSRLVATESRPLARAVGRIDVAGPFNLTLRCFLPGKSLLEGTYKYPPVRRLK